MKTFVSMYALLDEQTDELVTEPGMGRQPILFLTKKHAEARRKRIKKETSVISVDLIGPDRYEREV